MGRRRRSGPSTSCSSDTVEFRVREVLEAKLAVILEEFGVDKTSDVMNSAEAEPLFEELFVQGLQTPDAIENKCDSLVSQLRSTIAENRKSSELLADSHDLDADVARKWRDHPAQFWLERAITNGLPARGGDAIKEADAWRVRWVDGSELRQGLLRRKNRRRPSRYRMGKLFSPGMWWNGLSLVTRLSVQHLQMYS